MPKPGKNSPAQIGKIPKPRHKSLGSRRKSPLKQGRRAAQKHASRSSPLTPRLQGRGSRSSMHKLSRTTPPLASSRKTTLPQARSLPITARNSSSSTPTSQQVRPLTPRRKNCSPRQESNTAQHRRNLLNSRRRSPLKQERRAAQEHASKHSPLTPKLQGRHSQS